MFRYGASFLLVTAIVVIGSSAALDHAKTVRRLVHQSDWAAVGSLSTSSRVPGFPMVNVVSVDDSNPAGNSTGRIHFMLTDMDFTGQDWRVSNKVTFLFSDEQNKNCAKINRDPMEPTCARTIISGKIVEMNKKALDYNENLEAFIKRHPAAENWLKAPAFHAFYLCELEIENIFLFDSNGAPKTLTPEQYFNSNPDAEVAHI